MADGKGGMNNLLLRVLTAALLAPLVFYLTWKGGVAFQLMVLAAIGAALFEYLAMVEGRASPVSFALTWGAGMALAVVSTTSFFHQYAWALLVPGVMILLLVHLLIPGQRPASFERAALAVTGVFYVGALPACLLHLRQLEHGWALVFLAMMITWGSDTAAYFVGRSLGRRKLYPAVSPGKTWEGSAGGLLGAVGAALLARATFLPELGMGHAVAVALLAGVLAQLGDLVESLLKRNMGVKDSGRLLPGHGGMLDRIDALIFAVPAVWLYVSLIIGWKVT
ncbi:MAG: phosphatidate cytidylyltransferase [Deltaproteobacteria bacterium]|nr:phosphatidate cytidylyltransferase [Deltaproteobacteria bacterium]